MKKSTENDKNQLMERLIESFAEFKEHKNIDRLTLLKILKETFESILYKKFGTLEPFEVAVNADKGDLAIWHCKQVVEDDKFVNEITEIPLSKALEIEPDISVGEMIMDEIKISDFSRREVLQIRQYLNNKLIEFEKDNVYRKYKEKIGEIVICEAYQVWRREILAIDEEGIELILRREDQIPADNYKKGDNIRAVVHSVEIKNNTPYIYLSRTSEVFLERLLEQEVPEIYDGLITIRKIVRVPGERAKVAVESYDDRIDPVGACVGMKGSRINSISRELRNENIDIINYTNNTALFIQRALSPAVISSIKIDEENKRAEVYLRADQVSLAIGKGGHNIRLAARLTGYEIDVYRDSEPDYEDVALDEFKDEIEEWKIEELKRVGLDTAKSVLELGLDELIKRTDLEEEDLIEIMEILKAEFE